LIPGILSWASAPLQRRPKHLAAALGSPVSQKPDDQCHHRSPTSSASLEVSTPSASSSSRQRHDGRACIPDRLRLQVLTTSWRFHPPRASPALFHAGSALGVTLQSFLPLAQPHAVASAVPLLAFLPPSGSCSTRESATRFGCLDRDRARSSPGSFPLQGSPSLYVAPAFTGHPLLWLLIRTQAAKQAPLQGLSRRELGLSLSRPPTLLGFVAFWSSCPFELRGILESPRKAPGVRHRPLTSPS
jgi:hypothetical protein